MNKSKKSRVSIVENDDLLGRALKSFLEINDYEIDLYTSAEDFLLQLDEKHPDCILTDINLNGISGLELLKTIKKQYPYLPIILITGFGNIPMAVDAVKNGVFDFIEKPLDMDQILLRIREAINFYKRNVNQKKETARLTRKFNTLTDREKEVFDEMAKGYTNKIIAYNLGISIATVEAHRSRVINKLKCNSLAEIIKISKLLNH